MIPKSYDLRGVSPVIGVILMVAITVILAAIVGTFVFQLSGQVQEDSPRASFTFNADSNSITVTHSGGESIPMNQLYLKGNGFDNPGNEVHTYSSEFGSNDSMRAGDSVTVTGVSGSVRLSIVWVGADNSTSATLGEFSR